MTMEDALGITQGKTKGKYSGGSEKSLVADYL